MKNKKVTKNKLTAVKKLIKPYKRLTKEEYSLALQHPKWQKKRLKIFERDKWRCKYCGDTETMLHIHHLEYTKKYPWNELDKNLISICSKCHKDAHKIKY